MKCLSIYDKRFVRFLYYQIMKEQTSKCQKCQYLTQENGKLRQALKKQQADNKLYTLRNQSFANLIKLIVEFQSKMTEMNLSEEVLLKTFGFTLDEVLSLKSKSLLKKGKHILESIHLLNTINKNVSPLLINPQDLKKIQIVPQLKQEMKDDPDHERHQEVLLHQQTIIDQSMSQISLSQQLSVLTLTQLEEGFVESHQRSIQSHQYFPIIKNQVFNETIQTRNLEQFHQQQTFVNRLTQFISLPIVWQKNQAFEIKERMITLKVNKWIKLRSQDPLPKSGKYSMKFRVAKAGTMSFGLVIQPLKNGQYIYDVKQGVANYLSFSNGKGMIKYNGRVLKQSVDTYLPQDSQLEMIINFDKYELTYCNRRDILTIKLNETFRKNNVFLFLHMKDKLTAVKIL